MDKSIPFHSIILMHPNDVPPKPIAVPDGFEIRTYRPGDEEAWARIQTVVGEFENEQQALDCHQGYLAYPEELAQRQLFAIDTATGITVATATAWFGEENGKPYGTVHALSCLPECQGKHIGKVIASKMMEVFYTLSPGVPVWLDTQTWSYKAVGIYLDLGFIPMKTATFNGVANDYDAFIESVKGKMRDDVLQRFAAGSV